MKKIGTGAFRSLSESVLSQRQVSGAPHII